MAIFTHVCTNGVWEQQPEADFTGKVLEIMEWTAHVSSDNAMIDSGRRVQAKVWDRGIVKEVMLAGGRDCLSYKTGEVDATEDAKQKAREYRELTAWILSLSSAEYDHKKKKRDLEEINKGDFVEAVKGRKVKKGTRWYVYKVGNGSYGPYCHLSSQPGGLGECVQYVNPENLKNLASEPELTYPATPYGYRVNADVIAIALNIAKHLYYQDWQDRTDWKILLEAWEDSGNAVPAALTRAAYEVD